MSPSPFFSIIIPTFNRAAMLPKAIDSVLAQTYANWELIIVDDGSTDNTAVVIARIDDSRIRYIYQQNAERCAARNNGVAHALGSYICFLDSDDYYLPERLTLLYQELERRSFPCQMFYTGLVIDKGDHTELVKMNEASTGNVFDHIATTVIHSQQVCICCNILQEFKYDIRFRIGEDTELWLRVAQKYSVIYIKDQYTVAVLQHDDRSVNLMRYNSGAEQLTLYRFIFSQNHPGNNISAGVKAFMLAGCYHAIAKYNINHRNRSGAAANILRALMSHPQSPWSKFRVNLLLKIITLSPVEKVKALMNG